MSVVGWEEVTSLHSISIVAASLHSSKSTLYIMVSVNCVLEVLGTHSTGLGRIISGLGLTLQLTIRRSLWCVTCDLKGSAILQTTWDTDLK